MIRRVTTLQPRPTGPLHLAEEAIRNWFVCVRYQPELLGSWQTRSAGMAGKRSAVRASIAPLPSFLGHDRLTLGERGVGLVYRRDRAGALAGGRGDPFH
jgi:hypothetical protein